MSEFQENEQQIYVLTDDNGNEAEYELVFRDMINAHEYGVLVPVQDDEEAALCIIEILEDESSDNDDILPVDDDAIIEQVFNDFLEAFPEFDEGVEPEEET